MRRFTTFMLLLTVIFGLFSLISVSLGSVNSPPAISLQELGLSHCGNDLCVGAIHPSTTSWETTKAILSTQPDIEFDNYGATKYKNAVRIYFFKGIPKPDTNIHIDNVTQVGLMQLHELIELFGDPCTLTMTDDTTDFDIMLEYPSFIAEINLGTQKSVKALSPAFVIYRLHIWAETPQCKQRLTFPATFNISFNWCGFASFDHYLRYCRKTY